MPWKERRVADEKLCFVASCLRGDLPMATLCEQYGISRDTVIGFSSVIMKRAWRA